MDPFDLRKWPAFHKAGGDLAQKAIVDDIAIDSRRIHTKNALFIPFAGKHADGYNFIPHAIKNGAKFILVEDEKLPLFNFSIGKDVRILHVTSNLKAFQEIVLAYRNTLSTAFIAICGSFGKTMVKDTLASLIKKKYPLAISPESFNSQIGVPLSILKVNSTHDIAIIEAGMSQKGELPILIDMIQPRHTLLSGIGKKHLATLGSIEDVIHEFSYALKASSQWCLIPNHPLLTQLKNNHKNFYYWESNDPELPFVKQHKQTTDHIDYEICFPDNTNCLYRTSHGFSYIKDLLNIASKAAYLLNIDSSDISSTLSSFDIQPISTEIWRTFSGATIINGHYSSDPQSIDIALNWLKQVPTNSPKSFAFGGFENINDMDLAPYFKRLTTSLNTMPLENVMLFGSYPFQSLAHMLSKNTNIKNIDIYENWQKLAAELPKKIADNGALLIKGAKKIPFDVISEAVEENRYTTVCRINLAAISENIAALRRKTKNNRLLVMVKALAYGTDNLRIANFLATLDVDILGVSYIEEAVALAKQGVSQELLVLNAAPYEYSKVIKYGFNICVSDETSITTLGTAASEQQKNIKVHLHIDTGMGRFGCRKEEALHLASLIDAHPFLSLDGIMTHFAAADDPNEDAFTLQQIAKFTDCVGHLQAHGIHPQWIHAANSSAAIRFDIPICNMVRIGLAVYGLYPSNATQHDIDLLPVFSLITRIVGINYLKKGDTVGYGRNYTITNENATIAILPIGYHDGLHRHYSNKNYVIINGQKAPMVGKICMDYMFVDISHITNASIGDSALIFGEDEHGNFISLENFAQSGLSIVHELISCLGPRIPRIFVYEEKPQRSASLMPMQ